jgi:NDP-sugar pyrophosphorylase family protein
MCRLLLSCTSGDGRRGLTCAIDVDVTIENTPPVAWILAAGLGTRLRPLTNERPKPLVEVCGRPLIVHTLQLLADAGVRDVALNSHWLHPALHTALGDEVVIDDDTQRTIRLRYTHEPVALGTGGGLLGLRAVLPSSAVRALIANADALIDLDVAGLLATPTTPLSTLVLKAVDDVQQYGAIGTAADDRITTFAGRIEPRGPVLRERMFCGWHAVHPRALDVLTAVHVDTATSPATVTGVESCINKEGYPRWLTDGADLRGFDHAGLFVDVGTPERLWEANRMLLTGEVKTTSLKPFARFRELPGRVFVHPRARIDEQASLVGPCLVDDGAVIEADAIVGPLAIIGPRVIVRPGVVVERAVVQSGLGDSVSIVSKDTVGVHVGDGCRVPLRG